MKGMSVSTPFTNVCHLQEKQLDIYLAFIDVAKAYDSLDTETLGKILYAIGVPLKRRRLTKAPHETPDIKSN